MSGKIPRAFIDDLLVRVDIVELIDTHVPLKKTGSNYVARCPFHTEKSPSFSVNRNKQFYYCFGCGAGGNAISFLMEFNHLDFVEAVEDLAAFVGIAVVRELVADQSGVNKQDLQSIYDVLQRAAEYYAEQLHVAVAAKKAVAYLKARGVSGDFAKRFMLGYAGDEWQALEGRFASATLLAAGLVIAKADSKCYDRFRGRLMFPIRDKRGRVVGFGARVLDDSLPKYLNSPETPVFQKGREAYGLYELLANNARPARILVVEGYMDVIALAQAGIDYAVATLGTATSKAHLDLLFRYTSEVVLCFDGDDAGRKAAWRAMDVVFDSLKEGRQVRVMLLPQGVDPDSLVREEGKDRFAERIILAQTLSEYFFEQLSASTSLADIEGRAKLVGTAKPFLIKLPEGIFRDMMFARLKELSGGISQQDLSASAVAAVGYANNPRVAQIALRPQDKGRLSTARTVIALLLQNPRLIECFEQRDVEWDALDFPGMALLRKVVQAILDMPVRNAANTAVIIESFRDSPDYKVVVLLASVQMLTPEEGIEIEFCDGLDGLLKQAHEKRVTQLLEKSAVTELNERERETLKKMNYKQIR
ncbi:MAG: DNA primase [Methylococcaceae bacterium]|nr:DNA primase [Methylococcaceae bacterium]